MNTNSPKWGICSYIEHRSSYDFMCDYFLAKHLSGLNSLQIVLLKYLSLQSTQSSALSFEKKKSSETVKNDICLVGVSKQNFLFSKNVAPKNASIPKCLE